MLDRGNRLDHPTSRGSLRRCWRGFNRWRKRYFVVRLLYLFVMAGGVCITAFRSPIVKLVRYAIQAIEAASDPSLVTALARHKRIRLAHHLQLSLRGVVDLDRDGTLSQEELNHARELGLDPEDLLRKSVHADLTVLIEVSHRAGLLPPSYTAAIARHEARFAAQAEVNRMKRPARAEIEAMLRTWRKPDYSRVDTWARGTWRFLRQLDLPFRTLGWSGTVVVWLIFCFSVTLMVISFVGTGRIAKSLLLGGTLSLPIVAYVFLRARALFYDWSSLSLLCSATGFLCVSMASAAFAAKMAERTRNKRLLVSIGAMVLGITLLVWALPRLLSGEAFGPGYIPTVYPDGLVSLVQIPAGVLFYVTLPMWVKDAAIVVGGICLIAGLIGFARLPRSEVAAKKPVPDSFQDRTGSSSSTEPPHAGTDS